MKNILLIPVTLLLLLSPLTSGSDARTLGVGVYDNEPMVFLDEDGKPRGFYIDLLEHVASAEGWELSYVPGKRSECLGGLLGGAVDILPGVGLEAENGGYYLTQVTVLSDWGQVYSGRAAAIETMGDLSERSLAVARDDCLYARFRETAAELGINCHFVEVDGYDDAVRMVGEGVVDACLVPRLYAGRGLQDALKQATFPGPSVALHFGVSKTAGETVAGALDARIAAMMEDRGSAYYKAQNLWFGHLSVGKGPDWSRLTLVLAAVSLVAMLASAILYRTQLNKRTLELKGEVSGRKRVEEALRKSEEKFHSLYDKMNEGMCLHEMIFDEAGHAVDYIVLDINPSYESILGLGRDDVIGKRASELFDTEEPPFLAAYADVAVTERHTTFDSYFPPARRYFRVSAFSPQSGKVAAVFSDVTESKEEMDELKTSEDKYRILFENAPDAMYMNDLSGVLVDGNQAAERLLGYKKQELIGENVLKAGLIPIEQTLKAANNISLCAQGKPTGPDEFTLIRKDGTSVETEISTHPVKIDGQTLALGIARDVTERKQAEESLRESEERLHAVYDSMGEAVIISDLNGNIQQVNRATVGMLDYASKDELTGSHAYLCIAESDRQRASEDMVRALKVNERIREEYEFLKRGGAAVTCAVDIDLLRDKHGNTVGFVTVARDVTERKEEDRAIRDDMSKYKSLLEGLDEAVFRVSLPVGKYDYVSPSVKRVFGYTSEDFLKNPLLMRKLIHEDYARYFNEMWKDVIQGHIKPSYEYKIVDRDDRERYILQKNRRVLNEAGKVMAIEGIWKDITEQKQVYDSMGEDEELYRTAFEASSTALQLYDGNRRLVRANNACLDLFGVGDFKDLAGLNLLADESTPEEAGAGLEVGKSVRWETTLDFGALLERGSFESRRSGTTDVEIVVSPVGAGDGSACGYVAEIRGVTRHKPLEIQVRRSGQQDSSAKLTGAMGQDFSNILAAIMGRSEHLSGDLPAHAVEQKEGAREPAGNGRLKEGSRKILLVEGDETARSMACRILSERGYDVHAVGCARGARETFEQQKYEFGLLLCDTDLPDGNGLDLAEELRSGSPNLKILLTTGCEHGQRQSAGPRGRDFALLEKPYALYDLLTAIKNTVSRPARHSDSVLATNSAAHRHIPVHARTQPR